jgi:hypothetical protein
MKDAGRPKRDERDTDGANPRLISTTCRSGASSRRRQAKFFTQFRSAAVVHKKPHHSRNILLAVA